MISFTTLLVARTGVNDIKMIEFIGDLYLRHNTICPMNSRIIGANPMLKCRTLAKQLSKMNWSILHLSFIKTFLLVLGSTDDICYQRLTKDGAYPTRGTNNLAHMIIYSVKIYRKSSVELGRLENMAVREGDRLVTEALEQSEAM